MKYDLYNTAKAINNNHGNTIKYININSNSLFEKLFDKYNKQDSKLNK